MLILDKIIILLKKEILFTKKAKSIDIVCQSPYRKLADIPYYNIETIAVTKPNKKKFEFKMNLSKSLKLFLYLFTICAAIIAMGMTYDNHMLDPYIGLRWSIGIVLSILACACVISMTVLGVHDIK